MDRKRIFWIAAAVLIASALVWHAWHSACDHDEIEHLHAVWMVGQGEAPFKDFLEQHHPTLWYAMAPLADAFHSTRSLIFASRLLQLVCLAAYLWLFVGVARLLYPTCRGGWPLLMLVASFTFVRNMMEVRPDPWMNLLAFAGLFAWLVYIERGGYLRALLAGLLFGAAIAMLQKAMVVLALTAASSVATLVLIRGGRRVRRHLAGLALLISGSALPVALLFFMMWRAGLWKEFYFWNYSFNSFFYLHARLPENFTIMRTLWSAFISNPVLLITGIPGLWLMIRGLWATWRRADGSWDARFAVAFIAIGYFASLAMSRMPFDQYFIVWLPMIALASIESYLWLRSRGCRIIYEAAAVAMAVELVVIAFAYRSDAPYREVRERVLATTSHSESVTIPPPRHPITRRDGTYFWYNGSMIAGAYEDYCRLNGCDGEALERDARLRLDAEPAYVFIDRTHPGQMPYIWDEKNSNYEADEISGLFRRQR